MKNKEKINVKLAMAHLCTSLLSSSRNQVVDNIQDSISNVYAFHHNVTMEKTETHQDIRIKMMGQFSIHLNREELSLYPTINGIGNWNQCDHLSLEFLSSDQLVFSFSYVIFSYFLFNVPN